MKIKPLSEKNIAEATALLHVIFPDDAKNENPPEKGFEASLHPETHKGYWDKYLLTRLKYWVAIDEQTGRVIGTTGLYERSDSPQGTVWLGWYALDPAERGRGLGAELLQWTIDKAKDEGHTKLRLYTSTHSNEATAQKLYEKLGFRIVGEEPETNGVKVIYREREL
jgi:RimJ/RimL family protein N-acetyltransferase